MHYLAPLYRNWTTDAACADPILHVLPSGVRIRRQSEVCSCTDGGAIERAKEAGAAL